MSEIQATLSVTYNKGGVHASMSLSFDLTVDANLTGLVHQTQVIGTGAEAIDFGDVGIVHESLLVIRNMDAAHDVRLIRMDADYGETIPPGKGLLIPRVDGALLNKYRLQADTAPVTVELLIAQVKEIIV